MKLSNESVILFGSGISIWHPSNIPSGRQISNQLLSYLFGKHLISEWEREDLSEWFEWIPFETINQFAPSTVILRSIYSKLFDIDFPNILHHSISAIANHRSVKALITTNYDRGIELTTSLNSQIIPITDPETLILSTAVPLFKVHGCTSSPETLVYKLDQEAMLSNKKKVFLHKLLKGRTLYVLGYSGIDFELCPSIASSQASSVIWFHKNGEEETPGFRVIANSIPTTRKIVDLGKGLPWEPITEILSLSNSTSDIQQELKKNLTTEERTVWSVKLASSIGFASLALKLINGNITNSSTKLNKELILLKGYALFQSGQYLSSAKSFVKAGEIYRKDGQRIKYIQSILDTCDAWRAGGYYIRALRSWLRSWILIILGNFSENDMLISQLKLKLVLLMKMLVLLVNSQFIFPSFIKKNIFKAIQSTVGRLIKHSYKHATLAGNVFDQKQLLELNSFFGINNIELDSYTDGYGHLGYLSASTTFFRISKLNTLPSKEQLVMAEKRFHLMNKLGNKPEAWKIALRLSVLVNEQQKQIWENRALDILQTLEYTNNHRKRISNWVRHGAQSQ